MAKPSSIPSPIRFLLFTLMMITLGCASVAADRTGLADAGDAPPAVPRGTSMIETHTLGIDESVTLPDGSRLIFEELMDSRCPRGVQCVTAGEAKATFSRRDGRGEDRLVLVLLPHRDTEERHRGRLGEWQLNLIAVDPYPDAVKPSAVKDRRATVEISRGSEP